MPSLKLLVAFGNKWDIVLQMSKQQLLEGGLDEEVDEAEAEELGHAETYNDYMPSKRRYHRN